MKQQQRHSKIIDFLQKKSEGSVADFLSLFDNVINRRTLQRDLTDLSQRFIIISKGAGRAVKYSLAKNYFIFQNIDGKKYFSQNFESRKVQQNFNFEIFEFLKQNIFSLPEKEKLHNLHREFIKNFSSYDSQTIINKEFERIMIEFSWKSSKIEGNTYSLLNTEALIKENVKDETKTALETQMILNHKDAFNESMQNKQQFVKLKVATIEYLHSILVKKLNITKNIRKSAVGITGTKYKPLDSQFQIKEALQEMVLLINDKNCFFEKSFLSLILLSYIQGFEDGNKRIARMLSNAILLANHSIPLSYRIVDVVEYKKASILFYETNNTTSFKTIFIDQFENAVNNYFVGSRN